LVTVAGKGMMGVPGIAARTFRAVHAAGLSVSTIFQASSESSIGFTLPESDSAAARHALRRALKEELAAGLIDDVTSRSGVSVIAVVGNGMAGTPGIAARVFSALAAGGVNVIAIAQGSSEMNISFVVNSSDAPEAARRVHAAFQLSKRGGGSPAATDGTDVVLLGFGGVGRALARQISSRGRGHGLRAVALLDRSGCLFDAAGVSNRRLRELAARKGKGASLVGLGGLPISSREALAQVSEHAVSRPVLVDVTAEDTTELLLEALAQGFDLVLANKQPLAGSLRGYRRLVATAAALGRQIRFEATVGAGLPILDTQHKLAEAGDRILRIEGCVSGTLGYVLSAVSQGRPFSKALGEARERGYCEPDPREDLSGRDAARKGLILARLLGYAGPSPRAESLVPARLRPLPRGRFLERLPSLDRAWQRRVSTLAARGKVPRYVVRVTASRVDAGLRAVDRSSPLGSLEGTRNLVLFKTRRYSSEPLVISGPGAGVELTASGILNDLLALTRG
jgi:aspartokinase/homoserine dehydrogenase 1